LGITDIKALFISPPGHDRARMKSLSRRKVDEEGGRKPGRKPAKDGPGFQVDGPRAWGWHLSVAGAEERGQAGMWATRSAARAGGGPGWAEEGDLGGARGAREYCADDLGVLDRREQGSRAENVTQTSSTHSNQML